MKLEDSLNEKLRDIENQMKIKMEDADSIITTSELAAILLLMLAVVFACYFLPFAAAVSGIWALKWLGFELSANCAATIFCSTFCLFAVEKFVRRRRGA